MFKIQDVIFGLCLFFDFKDAIIVDASNIMSYNWKIFHSSHYLLFLLESMLDYAGIVLLSEDEFEVIIGVALMVSNKVKIV